MNESKKKKFTKVKGGINAKNRNSGITLIALVVTIIILLILAGISIGMLSGDNSIIKQAGNAKKQTNIAEEKEILEQATILAMGKSKYGDIDKEKLDTELNKYSGINNTQQTEEGIEVTFSSGRTYLVDANGNVTSVGPRIIVDENSLLITAKDGKAIEKGKVPEGTELKISFNASVEGGTVTISPSLSHITTAQDIENKKVIFTLSANVSGENVPSKTYIVDLSDVYSNIVTMDELKKNASKYFGWDVINYAETLPSNLQDTTWQLFYAGAIDGETEERIYLISKDYAKNIVLPAKNGATPIAIEGSEYKAKFSTKPNSSTIDASGFESGINDGVIPQYTGSTDIDINLRKLNRNYFNEITNNSIRCSNIRAVAYMVDTEIWNPFATSTKGYAEYAIGGPTVELLFTAYNKYKGLSGANLYTTRVINNWGYEISIDGGTNYAANYNRIIENDTDTVDNPYSMSNNTNASGYFLASPSKSSHSGIMYVWSGGHVSSQTYDTKFYGFRPLIRLNSNYTLEKTKNSNGNDAFKIVEQ